MDEIMILGFGKSNQSCVKFLLEHNVNNVIVVCDQFDKAQIEFLTTNNVNYCQTNQYLQTQRKPKIIIKSPGIYYSHPILTQFSDVEIINDIEIAYQYIKKNNLSIRIIGITGTNGKTSTTLLLTKILQLSGYNAFSCGNVGVSPLEILLNEQIDFLVMELSSFQLLNIDQFSPEIAIILNIAPDHLDYHQTFDNYLEAKTRLIKNTQDLKLIVSGTELVQGTNIKYINTSKNNYHNSISGNNLAIIEVVLDYLQIDKQLLIDFLQAKQFVLPHRIEYVDEIKQVVFINDSKATNLSATINALNQFENIILLVGGSSKDEDMHPLQHHLTNVKQVIAYGTNKVDFAFIPGIVIVDNLLEATNMAYQLASAGDVILLSPASASLDQFKNYEDRGNRFKEITKRIKEREF